jgi:hypothetical protein
MRGKTNAGNLKIRSLFEDGSRDKILLLLEVAHEIFADKMRGKR